MHSSLLVYAASVSPRGNDTVPLGFSRSTTGLLRGLACGLLIEESSIFSTSIAAICFFI